MTCLEGKVNEKREKRIQEEIEAKLCTGEKSNKESEKRNMENKDC